MHEPTSIAAALGVTGLGNLRQLDQFIEELPRVFLLAAPGVLLPTMMGRAVGGTVGPARAAARIASCLLVLVWLRLIATQWYISADLWRPFFPTNRNASPQEANLYEAALNAATGTIAAIGCSLAILLVAFLLQRTLRRWSWGTFPLRPLAIQLILADSLLLWALVVVEIGLVFDTAGRIPFELYDLAAILPLILMILLGGIRPAGAAFGSTNRMVSWWVGLAVLIIVIFPTRAGISTSAGTVEAYRAIPSYLGNLFWPTAQCASALLIIPVAAMLRKLADDQETEIDRIRRAGAIIFVYILMVGQYGSWVGFLTVLVGLLATWPFLALAPTDEMARRRKFQTEIQRDYGGWIARVAVAQTLREALRSPKLSERLGSGEIAPAVWSETRGRLEQAYQEAVDATRLNGDVPVRSLLLGYPLEASRWSSAIRAVRFGAPLIFLLALYRMQQGTGYSGEQFEPLLPWMAAAAAALGLPLALTLTFGFFFEDLRGGSGLNKALWLSAAIAAASAPALFFRVGNQNAIAATVWQIAPQVLLLIAIGIFGFDYPRMREIQGRRFDWRRFSWFGDTQLLSAGLAATSAAAVPVLASLISKDFASMIDAGLKAFTGS